MAKKPSVVQNILTILNGGFNFGKTLPATPDAVSPRVVNDAERDKLLRISTQSDAPRLASTGGQSGFMMHAQNLLRGIAGDKIENDRILDMAPEVSQAAAIMIPSIISPNDLRNSAITITSTCKEISATQNKKIGEYLTKFFEDELKLSTALPIWIEDALYRSGAKPLLILPTTVIQKEMTSGPHVIASQETFNASVERLDKESLYGISDARSPDAAAEYKKITAATESFGVKSLGALLDSVKPDKNGSTKKKSDFHTAYGQVVQSVLARETLSLIDNPESIQLSHTRTKQAKTTITNKTKLRYRTTALLSVVAPEPGSANIGNPTFIALPSECVIPIYTPGAPNDHIGYFILLNEFGHPIEVTSSMGDSLDSAQNSNPNQAMFQNLFQAYGMTDFMQNDNRAQNAMTDIYQNIIEAHLQERLSKSGFGNVGIGRDSNVYRYMFSRHLQQRKTKILFVPKDLLTYFCFKYNEYGVGESKLNELKFILSLRISLIVCRMMVAFNNAVDRKKIEINFDPGFTGNVLEHMRTVQREAMRKSMIAFSHDPLAVAQQVVNKSYTVKAQGIPGLPDYNITSESNQKNDAAPDEALSDDLKNLLILKLDVPAAAMNNLGEAEYSRSIVTTNLFFSRSTMAKQKIVITHLDDMIRKYSTYSADIIAEITKHVISDGHQDNVTADTAPNAIVPGLIEKVISGIKSTLPAPNIAPNKAQFEAIDGMLTSLDGILGAVLNDDLVNGNAELGTVVTSLRGLAKSQMVRKYVEEFGFGDINLPMIQSADQIEILKLRQSFTNISRALSAQDKVFAVPDTTGGDFGTDPNATSDTPTDNFDQPPVADPNAIDPDADPAELTPPADNINF